MDDNRAVTLAELANLESWLDAEFPVMRMPVTKAIALIERLTPREMTLFDVVRVFNRLNYLGHRDWFWEGDVTLAGFVSYGDHRHAIQAKEARYIAQGLERDEEKEAANG